MGKKKVGHDHSNDGGKMITVVFKVEVHCEGCGSRIIKAARGVSGVESAKVDCDKDSLTIVGEVDPVKLRDKLESKLKKKIVLVSPLPKEKEDQKTENKKPEGEKKADENKSKEKKPPAAKEVVLKLHLHCVGCIEKIHHILTKNEDVESISFDKQKDLVTVKGTMDVESICEVLEKKMKRSVEVVPPKKSDGKEKEQAAEKKVDIAPAGDGGKQAQAQAEFNRMMMMRPMQMPMPMPIAAQPGYGYGYGYGFNVGPAYPSYYPVQNVHALQMFSDENPNACSVM